MNCIPFVLLLFGLSSTLVQTTAQIIPTENATQSSTSTQSSTTQTMTQSTSTATTTTPPPPPPRPSCESKNGTSCDACLEDVNSSNSLERACALSLSKVSQEFTKATCIQCLWCIPTKKCVTYPAKTILPPHSLCPLNDARWGLCTINFQILIITLSVAAALFIIGFLVCIFCCCKCENAGSGRFDNKMNRKLDKTKTKQEERKAEMKTRHDEIRQKYGLSRASPYARFENPN